MEHIPDSAMDETEEQNTIFEDVAEVTVENSTYEPSSTVDENLVVDEDDEEDLDDELLEELLNAPESGDEEDDDGTVQEFDEVEMEDAGEGASSNADKSKTQTDKLVRLPLSRIKQIIKLDDDVDRVNGDAVFVIAKAAELFVQSFAKEIYKITERSKKKTVQLRDINTCIEEVMCMQFLEGCFLEQL